MVEVVGRRKLTRQDRVPSLVAAPLVATFGSVAISVLLCGRSLLSLVCAGALAETKGRELGRVLVGAHGG